MSDYEDFDYNKPMSLKIWKKMLPFIGPQKRRLFISAALQLCAAAVDVVLPLILGYAIRHNIEPRTTDGMWGLLAAASPGGYPGD